MLCPFHIAEGQALHRIQSGWTKDQRNHHDGMQCLSSNKEIWRGRNEMAGYISSLKEKGTSFSAYCTPWTFQFFLYSHISRLSPTLIFSLLSKSQTKFAFILNYPKERPWFLSSWKTHRRVYSNKAIHTILYARRKDFTLVESFGLPIASPSYDSKIRH